MAKFRIDTTGSLANFAKSRINQFPPQQAEDSDERIATSFLGTPIYDNIVLSGENTELGDSTELRIDEVLITVNQSKNIITTPINGRNGTVKEYISDGDYVISINGFIVSNVPNLYPRDRVNLLVDFCKVQSQIKISSDILNSVFNIQSIVIDNYTIAQTAGFRNRVPFTISCLSDDDIEIQIIDDAQTT